MDNNKNPFKENNQQEEEIKETVEKEADKKDDAIAAEDDKEDTKETIEESNEELNEEENATDELSEKYEELNNKYIRLAADFDNFRKRTQQEKDEISKYTTIEVLKKIVPVIDTFDRAQEQLKNIDNCQTVKEGYEVAYKQLLDVLKKMGLVEIEALGANFNPNEHEAITQVPTDEYEPDTIALVAQKGYKLNDKIVRPALVGVAKEKEE